MMLNNVLHCVVFASTPIETQHDARIDLDPILVFPLHCILASGHQETPNFFSNKFVCFAN